MKISLFFIFPVYLVIIEDMKIFSKYIPRLLLIAEFKLSSAQFCCNIMPYLSNFNLIILNINLSLTQYYYSKYK